LLELRDPDSNEASGLIAQLHTRDEWRQCLLRELLPGLDLVDSPSFSDRLTSRAANSLARAGASTLGSLAAMTPAAIYSLPNVGRKTTEEILASIVREWASAFLRRNGSARLGATGGSEWIDAKLRDGLMAITTWASAVHGSTGVIEGIVAAAESRERLPKPVRDAMRELTRLGTPPTEPTDESLALEFRRIEESSSFAALELEDAGWSIRIAVDRLKGRLGAVARTSELRQALAELDPDGDVLPDEMPQRSALLLRLAGYSVSDEWVLGSDIEDLTKTVLSTSVASRSIGLDAIERQLAELGVREELQLPWIISQYGFRIIDGELVPA
jgi:Bacterial RNA polymerase, alpha chain C terminal domain